MFGIAQKTSDLLKLGKNKIIALIIVAFTTIVVLSWNDAIKALIDEYFPKGNSIIAYFTTAIVLTLILVLLISIFGDSNQK